MPLVLFLFCIIKQRGTRAVRLEQKVMTDFCGLNSKTDLHNQLSKLHLARLEQQLVGMSVVKTYPIQIVQLCEA